MNSPFPQCFFISKKITMNRFQKKKIILHNILSSSLTIILLINFVSFVQRAKKVVPDSPGLMDFAIGLVVFVLNLPDGKVLFFGEIQITEGL